MLFTMFEFSWQKRIERSRRRHYDTLLATCCTRFCFTETFCCYGKLSNKLECAMCYNAIIYYFNNLVIMPIRMQFTTLSRTALASHINGCYG